MAQVLLIEPDKNLAEIIQIYFDREHKVFWTQTAQEAVTYANENKVDIVILELALPRHNGLAFLQEFRSYSDWSDVPVIIYSLIPNQEKNLQSKNWDVLKVSDYLYKPQATLASLRKSINRELNINETEE